LILLGINYLPEVTGIAPYNAMLANWLKEDGWDVEVVTTFPYYPAWRKIPGDMRKVYRRDEVEGITVYRVWHYVPKSVTTLKRIVHEASFVVTALLRLFTLPRADVLFVVSPPLLLGVAASLYRLLKRVPTVFHVQDLQPDAAVGLGMLSSGPLAKSLYGLENLAYANATLVSGISPGMIEAFRKKGVENEKILFFPNPVEFPKEDVARAAGNFRRVHGISSDAFLVSYSGNLGVKQGLEQIIEVAALLEHDPAVQFVICGDGAMRRSLEKSVAEKRLSNVLVLPIQPLELYHALLVDSNICLVTQQVNSGASFFPSKLLTIMSFCRPVLAVADKDSTLAALCREEECGLLAESGDAEGFAREVLKGKNDPKGLEKVAERGRAYIQCFQRREVLARIEMKLQKLRNQDAM
jgi:colanic acid biosynthesis glycosyl transferase WcaI